jgi:hypothetical protein
VSVKIFNRRLVPIVNAFDTVITNPNRFTMLLKHERVVEAQYRHKAVLLNEIVEMEAQRRIFIEAVNVSLEELNEKSHAV